MFYWILALLVAGLITGIVPRNFWGIVAWSIFLAIAVPICSWAISFIWSIDLLREALTAYGMLLGIFLAGVALLVLILLGIAKLLKGMLGLKDFGAGLNNK